MFKNISKFNNVKLSDKISISVGNDEVTKDFLFDVMNNPQNGQPYNNSDYNLLFEDIYHTIGNFAPVPKTIVTKYYGPNLQLLHKDLNELWQWFLKFLKDN